jgi:hypothetical protein
MDSSEAAIGITKISTHALCLFLSLPEKVAGEDESDLGAVRGGERRREENCHDEKARIVG